MTFDLRSESPISGRRADIHLRTLIEADVHCDQSGHANSHQRPLTLSSEPHLRFGLCRQRREPSRSAWRSRAHRPPVEKMVQECWQKNSADIGVPNPREHQICRCNLCRLRSDLISVAQTLRWVGHMVPKRNLPERKPLCCVRGGAIERMIDGKSNASKRKRHYGLPLTRRMPGWRQR